MNVVKIGKTKLRGKVENAKEKKNNRRQRKEKEVLLNWFNFIF